MMDDERPPQTLISTYRFSLHWWSEWERGFHRWGNATLVIAHIEWHQDIAHIFGEFGLLGVGLKFSWSPEWMTKGRYYRPPTRWEP